MRRSFISIVFLCSAFLGGCAIDPVKQPYLADILTDWKVHPLDETTQVKMSYLGRFILSESDRRPWIEKMGGVPGPQFDGATATGALVAQATTGNMFSNQGVKTAGQVKLAIDAVSLFLPDGSMKKVSGLYLPEEFNGQKLENATQALDAAWAYAEKQLMKAAESIDRTAICWQSCSSTTGRAYLLKRQKLNPRYNSNPEYILATIGFLKDGLSPMKRDPQIEKVLGFSPKWTSGDGNTFALLLHAAQPKVAGEQPSNSPVDNMQYARNQDLAMTRLGIDFLRSYHSDGYSYYAQDEIGRRFLTYKGKVYRFVLTNGNRFIHEEMTGEILASN